MMKVTAFNVPPRVTADELVEELLEHGFDITEVRNCHFKDFPTIQNGMKQILCKPTNMKPPTNVAVGRNAIMIQLRVPGLPLNLNNGKKGCLEYGSLDHMVSNCGIKEEG